MSSVLPGRRALRATRIAANKDNENANARPSTRTSSRAKPLSSNPSNINQALAPTGKSKLGSVPEKDDPAAGKRKREVLTEVTALVTNNRIFDSGLRKGKEKEDPKKFDGVVINKTKTVVTSRKPLRSVSSRSSKIAQAKTTTSTTTLLEVVTETVDVQDENAMQVDPPAEPILPSLVIRKSLVPEEKLTHPSRHTEASLRPSHPFSPTEDDDPEVNRVFKKRRTSEAPEDPQIFAQAKEKLEQDAIAAKLEAELAALEDELEADPDGDQWQDLDAEDADDPLMVSEYVLEVFDYFKDIEIQTMPNPNYMANQPELSWNMRGILSDWLVQLHTSFRLLPETLFLAVNIIDRFLSARVVSLAKLQLVGITSMFIAAKVEEVIAPSVNDYVERADGTYTKEELMTAERYILKTLDWNLSYPNPVQFLRRISKADEYNVNVRTLGKYLMEIGCLEWRLIAAPPSLLGAAAMWLARLMLGSCTWTPNLAHYSSYAESSLIPTANLMINYILKPIRHEAFYKKYAHRKFCKVSIYSRTWALKHWPEKTQISLLSELPALKREIRAKSLEQRLQAEKEALKEQQHTQLDDSRFVFGQIQNLDSASFRFAA